LKRVGERGEGKWKRVSWDEALADVADHFLDVLRDHSSRNIYWDMGGGMTNGADMIGIVRTIRLLDNSLLDIDSEVGDHHPGAAVTCGKIVFSSSADDLFYSDLILVWVAIRPIRRFPMPTSSARRGITAHASLRSRRT
jgi:anaerobic selenocysteine-containing dehydrogenase